MTKDSEEIFNVLRNIRKHLDKVLEMNQINDVDTIDTDVDEDKVAFDTIECHLIECVSVICHAIKQNQDNRIKNVTLIIKYLLHDI